MVHDAVKGNMSFDYLLHEAISFKKQLVIAGNISFGWCQKYTVETAHKFEIVEGFQQSIGLRGDTQIRKKV